MLFPETESMISVVSAGGDLLPIFFGKQ